MDGELAARAQRGDVDGEGFGERERLAVRWAERAHDHVDTLDDELLAELRAAFDDAEFVELGMTIAQFVSMGQFVKLLGVPNPDVAPLDDARLES